MNKRIRLETIALLKVSVLLACSVTMLPGCRALSERLDPDRNGSSQNLPRVNREQPNLASEPAPIKTDPDAATLVETAPAPPKALPTPEPNPENGGPNGNFVVTFDSFGVVKIGMTVAEAEQALHAKLVLREGSENGCSVVEPEGMAGVRFVVTSNKIARVDISSASYATDKGAKVGDREGVILDDLYPRARVQPPRPEDKRRYLEVYSEDERYMIVFETDGERIIGFRAGNLRDVIQGTGCSGPAER